MAKIDYESEIIKGQKKGGVASPPNMNEAQTRTRLGARVSAPRKVDKAGMPNARNYGGAYSRGMIRSGTDQRNSPFGRYMADQKETDMPYTKPIEKEISMPYTKPDEGMKIGLRPMTRKGSK